MVVQRFQQALALGLRRFRRPAKTPDLEAAAVVQFEELRREQAHGVHVQVTREIADADAPVFRKIARWHAAEQGLGRWLGHLLVDKALCRQQLQGGIVGQAHHGQQRGAHQELVGRHLTHRQVVRPGALFLADVQVVLDDVGLRGLELQAAAHQGFALGIATQLLQQPCTVVQRMQAQVKRGGRVSVEDGAPVFECHHAVAAPFGHVAQVQPRGCEMGLLRQGLLIGGLGGVVAPQRGQHRAPVEAGHMAQRRRGVRDPGLVQQRGRFRMPCLLQGQRALHQILQTELAATRSRQQRPALGRGNSRGDKAHGSNGNGHPAPPGCR